MPNMRSRKFVVQNKIRAKGKDDSVVLRRNQNDAIDRKNNRYVYFMSNELLPIKSMTSALRINKSTSTIEDSERINIPLKQDRTYNMKTNSKPLQRKSRINCNNNKEQHDEKPLMHKLKVRNSKHKTLTFGGSYKQTKVSASSSTDHKEIEDYYQSISISKEPVPRTSCAVMCRICHGGDSVSEFGQLVSACSCKGTIGKVHVACLETWLTESGKSRCELCSMAYAIRRVHKYGLLEALTIWLLSQNSKQLVVDMLGTVLMMPLAILAAWLSGTTLLNLMSQEDDMAAWPLVSSFMLSCTTLVCYYCWIVSAATRHAISWWVWYQSQYEVRLQLQNSRADDEYCTSEAITYDL